MINCADCCPSEKQPQSIHSPSVVSNEEILLLIIMEPEQFRDNEFRRDFIDKRRLRDGLSISRKNESSIEAIMKNIVQPQINKNPNRFLKGVLIAVCADVRKIAIENPHPNTRAICVIDDGSKNDMAHAHLMHSIHASAEGFWKQNNWRSVVENLLLAFKYDSPADIIPLEKIFAD